FGGAELGLGLTDGGLLRGGLPAEPLDGRLLHGDLVACRLHGEAVVAVLDAGDHVTRSDARIVLNRDKGDIAGDLRRQGRALGADVGLVRADKIAPRRPPGVAVIAAGHERQYEADDERAAHERLPPELRRSFRLWTRRELPPGRPRRPRLGFSESVLTTPKGLTAIGKLLIL